ncbi:MAG: ABC transporter ATP-binding protein/permease [Desulfotalea sp.]
MQNNKEKVPFKKILAIVSPSFKKYKLRIGGGLLALVVVDLLQLIIPKILKTGVDQLSISGQDLNLGKLAFFIVAIAAFVVILRFCWRYMIIGFSRILECRVREDLFAHILKMDASFFTKNSAGKIMSHSSNDLNAVQMCFGMGTVAAVDASVMLLAAISFMMMINVKLTLLALMPMPILAISTRVLSAKLHKKFETVQEHFSELTEFSRSTVSSMRLVKAYTMEDLQTSRFDILGRKYLKANLKVAIINGLMHPISTLVANLSMLCVFFLGGRMVIQDVISLGDFVAFITYIYMIIWPMMAIGWVANLLQRGATSLSRIHRLLEQKSDVNDGAGKEISKTETISISIKNLSFSYPGTKQESLRNISLELKHGTYGLTGRTGSGKTTLCRLICRLYPVPADKYLFTGHDVNDFNLPSLREQISYVSQEPMLFSDSVSANISFGYGEAKHDEIKLAAKRAAIHDDIMALENGYQTMIGERGVKLSGGQRQRLALARALLSKRPILLIDDGLSAVDVETEHQIFSQLKEHAENKIIIIISNRIKLLSMTDEIIIFKEGELEDIGAHQDLLTRNSLYQSMAEKQQEAK